MVMCENVVDSEFIRPVNQVVQLYLAAPWSHPASGSMRRRREVFRSGHRGGIPEVRALRCQAGNRTGGLSSGNVLSPPRGRVTPRGTPPSSHSPFPWSCRHIRMRNRGQPLSEGCLLFCPATLPGSGSARPGGPVQVGGTVNLAARTCRKTAFLGCRKLTVLPPGPQLGRCPLCRAAGLDEASAGRGRKCR